MQSILKQLKSRGIKENLYSMSLAAAAARVTLGARERRGEGLWLEVAEQQGGRGEPLLSGVQLAGTWLHRRGRVLCAAQVSMCRLHMWSRLVQVTVGKRSQQLNSTLASLYDIRSPHSAVLDFTQHNFSHEKRKNFAI